MRLSVIAPAYNEAENLKKNMTDFISYLENQSY